jgi:hypothetical protein
MTLIGHCFNFSYTDMLEMDLDDFLYFADEANKTLKEK